MAADGLHVRGVDVLYGAAVARRHVSVDRLCIMDRGDIVLNGIPGELDESEVRRRLTV